MYVSCLSNLENPDRVVNYPPTPDPAATAVPPPMTTAQLAATDMYHLYLHENRA